MPFRPRLSLLVVTLAFGLVACDWTASDAAARRGGPAAVSDPVMARALNDPLMSDPDLALRSEANAVVSFADAAPLPVLAATPQTTERAREAARSALRTGGAIPPLAPLTPGSGGSAWGDLDTAAAVLSAAGAPEACRSALRDGFAWAAGLPAPVVIMPHGMAERAAGADSPGCQARWVRYLTPASIEDALTFHHTLAQRAGFAMQRHAEPEAMLTARGGKGERLHIHARTAPGGMNAVDLVFWTSP